MLPDQTSVGEIATIEVKNVSRLMQTGVPPPSPGVARASVADAE
jgi:hypothetical protein